MSIVNAIRWTARVLGTITVAFFVVMLAGHYIGGQESPPPQAILISILVMLAGFVLAWKCEAVGGALVIVGYCLNVMRSPQLLVSPIYLTCILIGVLFILVALFRRTVPKLTDPSTSAEDTATR